MRLPKITPPSLRTLRVWNIVLAGLLAASAVYEAFYGGVTWLAILDAFFAGFNAAAAIYGTMLIRAHAVIDELRTLNEFMHELNGQMLALCRERFVRLPDDVESPQPPRYH